MDLIQIIEILRKILADNLILILAAIAIIALVLLILGLGSKLLEEFIENPGGCAATLFLTIVVCAIVLLALTGYLTPIRPQTLQTPIPQQPMATEVVTPFSETSQEAPTQIPVESVPTELPIEAVTNADWQRYTLPILRGGCPTVAIQQSLDMSADVATVIVNGDGSEVFRFKRDFTNSSSETVQVGDCAIELRLDSDLTNGYPPLLWKWVE